MVAVSVPFLDADVLHHRVAEDDDVGHLIIEISILCPFRHNIAVIGFTCMFIVIFQSPCDVFPFIRCPFPYGHISHDDGRHEDGGQSWTIDEKPVFIGHVGAWQFGLKHDGFEFLTILQDMVAQPQQRAGEGEPFQSRMPEGVVTDIPHSCRQFDGPQLYAVAEGFSTDKLQSREMLQLVKSTYLFVSFEDLP